MDHRWDESMAQDRASRGEHERYDRTRIARDPDVERRDRIRRDEVHRVMNQSPWAIGSAWYDQRDLYTRNSSIDVDGYGRGPSVHPEEGSYAYPREPHFEAEGVRASDATLYEREAWPWLNYKEMKDDPYFAHLKDDHAPKEPKKEDGPEERHVPFWRRAKEQLSKFRSLIERRKNASARVASGGCRQRGRATRTVATEDTDASDVALRRAVSLALVYCRDLDSSGIEVSVCRGEVTLQGTVPNFRSRRLAGDVALGVPGVRDVRNRLTIHRSDPTDANAAFAFPLALVR